MNWFKRARRTTTDVRNEQTRTENRRRGEAAAYRATACTQMAAQLILWATLLAYDRSAQASWQAALLLALPLAGLYALWRAAQKGLNAGAAKYALLALLPCLLMDAAALVTVLDAMMGELIPAYSPHVRLLVIGVISLISAGFAGRNGVAYGVAALRRVLAVLFVLSTVLVGADVRVDRLWPILGAGLGSTALAALAGAGCVWGVALLFALPNDRESRAQASLGGKKPRTMLWAVAPLVMCVIWALWFGMARVWLPMDVLTMGEKMMGLARGSSSILLCEAAGLWWLLLLPCALIGCAMSAEKLLRDAVPKFPRLISAALVIAPACVFAFFCGDEGLGWLEYALPWRAAFSAAAAVAVLALGRKNRKRKRKAAGS